MFFFDLLGILLLVGIFTFVIHLGESKLFAMSIQSEAQKRVRKEKKKEAQAAKWRRQQESQIKVRGSPPPLGVGGIARFHYIANRQIDF